MFTPIYEIDMVTKRIKRFTGRVKVDKRSKTRKVYLRKYRKHLNCPSQSDYFYKGRQDVLVLVKDNNGLHHTLRFLDQEELVKFYSDKGINIKDEFLTDPETKQKFENPDYKHYAVYTMPNPHEDLDWLGNEVTEANKEYKPKQEWWQSPTIMVIGTAFVCMIMFVMTIILSAKL